MARRPHIEASRDSSPFLRNLAFLVLRVSCVPWLLRRFVQQSKVTILMYHDIDADRANVHFEALRRRYNVVALSDYLAAREMGTADALPPRSIIVTFDDGHRRNVALRPILEKHGIPATIFLCSGIAGTNRRFWFKHPMDQKLRDRLKTLPDGERLAVLRGLGFDETKEYDEAQALTAEEIQAMGSIVDFQAHTVFHPCLPRCSPDRARREIVDSKAQLQERFGLTVYALAYPNGDYSNREVELARDAGYRCAVTTQVGYADATSDLFRLPRLGINDEAGVHELVVAASGLTGLLRPVLQRRHLINRKTRGGNAQRG